MGRLVVPPLTSLCQSPEDAASEAVKTIALVTEPPPSDIPSSFLTTGYTASAIFYGVSGGATLVRSIFDSSSRPAFRAYIAVGPLLASACSSCLVRQTKDDKLGFETSKILNLALLHYNVVVFLAAVVMELSMKRSLVFATTAAISAGSCVRGYAAGVKNKDYVADLRCLFKSIVTGLFKTTAGGAPVYLVGTWLLIVLSVRKFAEALLLVAAGEPGLAVSRLFRLAKYKLVASSTFILKKNATGPERYSRTNKILKYSIWGAFATYVWYLKELGYIGEITAKLGGLFGFVTLKNIFKWLATWAYWGPAYPLV